MSAPRTLDELRSVRDPLAQALAAKSYIERAEDAARQARRVRDAAIREYLKEHGPTETAKACGVSLATVKALRR